MTDTTPPAADTTSASSSRFRKKKLLTRPVLKFEIGKPRYVKLQGPIYLGREMKNDSGSDGRKKKEPAHLVDTIDLETGAESQIIVSAVTLSVLEENYPDKSYVGKCFAITKRDKAEGKQYFPYNVEEIEDPTEDKKSEATQSAPPAARPGGPPRLKA